MRGSSPVLISGRGAAVPRRRTQGRRRRPRRPRRRRGVRDARGHAAVRRPGRRRPGVDAGRRPGARLAQRQCEPGRGRRVAFLDRPLAHVLDRVSVPRSASAVVEPPPRWSAVRSSVVEPVRSSVVEPVRSSVVEPVGRRWSSLSRPPARDLRRRPRPRQRGDRGPLRRRGRSRRGGVRRPLGRPVQPQDGAGLGRQPLPPADRCRPRSRGRRPCRPGGRARGPGRRWRRGDRPRRGRRPAHPAHRVALRQRGLGVAEELAALADHRVRIPIHGRAESLSLSTAAALCLYASARAQRVNRVRTSLPRPLVPRRGVGHGTTTNVQCGLPRASRMLRSCRAARPPDNWSRHVPYHSSSLVSDHLRRHRRVLLGITGPASARTSRRPRPSSSTASATSVTRRSPT